MKHNLLFFIIFFALLILNCNADLEKKVAKYDNGFVTYGEVISEYGSLNDEEKSKFTDINEFFKLARQIALQKIIVDKAVNEGLADTKEFISRMEDVKKKTVYNLLKKKNVYDKINITETDYARYKKSYELYQIVKRTDTLDNAKIEDSRSLLKKLSKQILRLLP